MTIQNINPATPGIIMLPLVIGGQRIATAAAVARFKLPFPATLLAVQASARASGGTTPTLDIDVQEAGTTLLSAAMSITAGAVTQGVIADKNLADEAEMTVDLAITGSSPTWDDIFLLLVLKIL